MTGKQALVSTAQPVARQSYSNFYGAMCSYVKRIAYLRTTGQVIEVDRQLPDAFPKISGSLQGAKEAL